MFRNAKKNEQEIVALIKKEEEDERERKGH